MTNDDSPVLARQHHLIAAFNYLLASNAQQKTLGGVSSCVLVLKSLEKTSNIHIGLSVANEIL